MKSINIFISYRRADTRDLAGRIADRLRDAAGIGEVFLDTGIAPGADFTVKIRAALAADPICIVLIGTAWAGSAPAGAAPRIQNKHDLVRAEIAEMLTRNLRILPVLTSGAVMPAVEELPEDLRTLANFQAMRVDHESFDRDVDALVRYIFARSESATSLVSVTLTARLQRGLIFMVVSLAVLLIAAVAHKEISGRSLDATFGGTGPVWLLICGVPILGALAGFFLPGRRRI